MPTHAQCVHGASVLAVAASLAVAGDLNPPVGPVAPTHKTLTEVEPRTAINSTNTPGDADSVFRITQPGSYYLAGNVTGAVGRHGVEIAADNVTLDLGGFALVGIAGSLDGVSAQGGVRGLTVRNGSARAWGGDGVDLSGAGACTIADVACASNGGAGIRAGANALVRGCQSTVNASDNIVVGGSSSVEHCIANGSTTGHGINASFTQSIVSGCTANGNALSGVRASQRTHVRGCLASNNTLHGVHVTFVGAVEGCFINGNGGDGVLMDAGGIVTIRGNTIAEMGGAGDAGIRVTSAGLCVIEDNTVSFCAIGILVSSTGNEVRGNTVFSNTDNYSFVAGNRLSLRLSQIPESIDWPADVVLAGTLTGSAGSNGVTITADDVTLDLGGHALVGVAGSLDGISSARRRITIRNGSTRNWGGDGVDLSQSVSFQCDLRDLYSTSNGGAGFRTGGETLFRSCQAFGNTGDGFSTGSECRFEHCLAIGSAGNGFNCFDSTAVNCRASGNALSGFRAQSRCSLSGCEAVSNGSHGIHITDGGSVEACIARNNTGDGIRTDAGGGVSIRNNTSGYNLGAGSAGIRVAVAGECHVEGNLCMFNSIGVRIDIGQNTIIRNSCFNNGTAFSIVANNVAGPVVTPATAAAATNPLANFSN